MSIDRCKNRSTYVAPSANTLMPNSELVGQFILLGALKSLF
jgi:hypothetical protein